MSGRVDAVPWRPAPSLGFAGDGSTSAEIRMVRHFGLNSPAKHPE